MSNWPARLNDFSRGILADYPNIDPEDLQIVLVHARDRILAGAERVARPLRAGQHGDARRHISPELPTE